MTVRQKGVLTIAACFLGVAVAWGQGQAPAGAKPSLDAPQDPREPAVLAHCKNPPLPAPDYGEPQLGLRDYKVIEIPGVIAAGQKWKSVWQQMGDNGDGIVGSPDGGLLIAQNDSSDVLKLDSQGKVSIAYTGTNTGGSLSMNSRGALFIVDRGFHASISELAPNRKTLADQYQGDPLDCSGVVLNDLIADSKGGAYFTMGGVFYANPSGQVTRYDGKNLRGPNGIILSANEKTLYVSNRLDACGLRCPARWLAYEPAGFWQTRSWGLWRRQRHRCSRTYLRNNRRWRAGDLLRVASTWA